MSIAEPGPAGGLHPRTGSRAPGLIEAASRLVNGRRERTLVAAALGVFVVLWMLYDTVSYFTVDVRDDASEAALWAQHFAFGYKHPPLTAWLFGLWFAAFPRADWAVHLQVIVIVAVTLAITWRLLRDHLDRNRALFGLAALCLVPLYTFKAEEINANTAMMPFWAAALLFYLRARRRLGVVDALLAGAFAGFTVLAKYWAVYLLAGMAMASVIGAASGRFWRSPAPYLMAAGAAIVLAPHLYWYATQSGGTNYAFVRESVMTGDSFGTAFGKSVYYLLGAIAYAAGPLLLLASLRPSRAALADIAWPADPDRQQALILFAVPLVLPALANLVLPHRLTPDWTFPNWALLPIVLYSAPSLAIDAAAAAAAGLAALAVSIAFIVASPFIAYARLAGGPDHNRPHSQPIAALARELSPTPVRSFWGSPILVGNLPFYLPPAAPLHVDPASTAGRDEIARTGVLIVCRSDDAPCLATSAALAGREDKTLDASITRSFFGFSGAPENFRLSIVPARNDAPPASPSHPGS
jgi:4-amino-4-deoxy-L-arabinose transferase-like glycosyltransferase